MAHANLADEEKSNLDVIKISDCRDTFIRFGGGQVDGNFYEGEEISSENGNITLQDCKQPECIVAEGKIYASGNIIGNYRKWANGFAECWLVNTLGNGTRFDNPYGEFWATNVEGGNFALPITFTNLITCSVVPQISDEYRPGFFACVKEAFVNKIPKFIVVSPNQYPAGSGVTGVNVRFYLAGYWK